MDEKEELRKKIEIEIIEDWLELLDQLKRDCERLDSSIEEFYTKLSIALEKKKEN